ncbi:MAG: Flp pilus assembly complex ATPase component TadA [Elusimicrobia bacterium]|nr:Flp pilus assembly complex ATPase component TadA [Elusimicrobiota bacterium]
MPEAAPAPDLKKLRQAAVMAAEILGLQLEALRQEFHDGRWAAFESAKGFLEGPYASWAARAGRLVREAPEGDAAELCNRLRAAFLDLERACRAFLRLLGEEKRARRDEVCAGASLAPTDSHEENLDDLLGILRSVAPALSDQGLRQLLELADAPEPGEGARGAHPAARLAGLLMLDAGRRGASDIAILPGPWVSLVQYRLGGVLVPILELPLPYHRALAARFKAMAGMDIAQKRRPQEGKTAESADPEAPTPRAIIRVLPTIHGERVDVHLEGPPKPILDPHELGLTAKDLERYEALLLARGGLIIHAGLSGTGRRTAMLAAAASLAKKGRGAFALLSHHHYEAPGVSVSTAPAGSKEQAELLKALLARKPDVLVIGELNDAEVMRAALKAAAEGSLVLGTLSCDGASAALRRLFDMELPADLVRGALLAVCGHRLPRRLCACHRMDDAKPGELELLGGQPAGGKLGRPVGCPACINTGFRGVTPAFELLTVGPALKSLLKPGVTDEEWLMAAQSDGMSPFGKELARLVLEGLTSPAEARRWGLGA